VRAAVGFVAHEVAVPQGHRDGLDGGLQAIVLAVVVLQALEDLGPAAGLVCQVE